MELKHNLEVNRKELMADQTTKVAETNS